MDWVHRGVRFLRGENTHAGRLAVGSERWAMVEEHQARRKEFIPSQISFPAHSIPPTSSSLFAPPFCQKTSAGTSFYDTIGISVQTRSTTRNRKPSETRNLINWNLNPSQQHNQKPETL